MVHRYQLLCSVLFVERATPATLTDFKDSLANVLLSVEDGWSMEFRTYRTQIKNYPGDSGAKLMYSLNFSFERELSVMVKGQTALLLSSDAAAGALSADPRVQRLVDSDCSTGFPESFDNLLSSKLSNMWEQRQVLRGDAGESFRTMGYLVRCINVFSSTGFKGLAIQVEQDAGDDEAQLQDRIDEVKELLRGISITEFKVSSDRLTSSATKHSPNDYLCDLAHQYVRVMES